MKKEMYISSACKIENNTVVVNNNLVYSESADKNFETFAKFAYKIFNVKYPKFYKMDNLCKLGFLTAEVLLNRGKFTEYYQSKYKPADIGIVITNFSSSLDTDEEFQKTIESTDNYFPSPAVFVYTLPNIMLGEISIRHKIKGENACFISKRFNDGALNDFYISSLFDEGKAKAVISGWVDYYKNNYLSVLYFIERDK